MIITTPEITMFTPRDPKYPTMGTFQYPVPSISSFSESPPLVNKFLVRMEFPVTDLQFFSEGQEVDVVAVRSRFIQSGPRAGDLVLTIRANRALEMELVTSGVPWNRVSFDGFTSTKGRVDSLSQSFDDCNNGKSVRCSPGRLNGWVYQDVIEGSGESLHPRIPFLGIAEQHPVQKHLRRLVAVSSFLVLEPGLHEKFTPGKMTEFVNGWKLQLAREKASWL